MLNIILRLRSTVQVVPEPGVREAHEFGAFNHES